MALRRTIALPSCHECGLLSSGRCPGCHHELCHDHFARAMHQPCASRAARHAADYACYICGEPVEPKQWAVTGFDHVIDYSRCGGCHRFLCDAHTAARHESLQVKREGQRGLRYRLVSRSCPTCARLHGVGGLLGLTRRVVAVAGGVGAVALVLIEVFRY
jgi:hypothetical protein